MASRPPARDNDAMAAWMTQIKARIASLEGRSDYAVGKSWHIKPSGPDLVAVNPREDATVVLASAGGMCGPVVKCVGEALDGTLDLDRGNKIGVRISGDPGNQLSVGQDRGLFATGESEPDFAEFAVTGPPPAGEPVLSYYQWEKEESPESFTKPAGVYGEPFEYSFLAAGPSGGGQVTWSTEHIAPTYKASLSLPAHSSGGNTGRNDAGAGWILLPWYSSKAATPLYMGDWLEAEAYFWLTDYPSAERVMLIRFFPGVAVFLTSGGRIEATPNGGHSGYPYPVSSKSHYITPVPKNTLFRVRLRVSLSGQTLVTVHITEPSSDDLFDNWVSLPYKINVGDFSVADKAPVVMAGTLIWPSLYATPVAAPPYPAVTMPQAWMSGLRLRVCHPDPVYWRTTTGGAPK